VDVKLKDGRILRNVPDDISQEEMVKTLDANGFDTSDLKAGWGPGELLKDVARGFVKGSAGIVDLATLPLRYGERKLGELAGKPAEGDFNAFPQSAATGAALDELLPTKPAVTPGRRYARAGLEGAGSGFSLPGPSAALTAAAGAGGGLGGEAMADAAGEGPAQRLVGGLLGGGAVGLARGVKPNRADLARETMEGSDPANVAIAIQRMKEARDQGLPINASQGMLRPSNIDDMIEFLANSRQGDQTINNLRTQPGVLALKAQGTRASLPGQITSPQDTANRVQEAATGALKASTQKAGAAYAAKLPPGTQVPPAQIEAFSKALDDYAAAHPNTAAATMAAEVKRRLTLGGEEAAAPAPLGAGKVASRLQVKPQPKAPQYLTEASQLKSAVEDAIQNHGANAQNTSAVSKDLNRYAQTIRTMFDRTVAPVGSPMREARAASRQIYVDEVNPLRKSVVGRLAGVRGADEVKEAPQAQLKAVLERGTPDGGLSEIKQLEKTLRKQDPTAFPDLVKTFVADKIESVLPVEGARVAPNLAEKLRKTLAGTKAASRGLDDMMAGVARSKGLDEDTMVKGFRNFVDLLVLAERVPNRISGLPSRDLADIAGKSATASAAEMRFMGSGLGHKIRSVFSADAYKFMDKMLNSPEGLEALQKLAKTGPKHPGSLVVLEGLLGASGGISAPVTQE